MKWLYLTDDYCWHEFGVKRSLYEELSRRVPVELCFYDDFHPEARYGARMQRMGAGPLFERAQSGGYSHVLFASSGLAFDLPLMAALRERAVLVGFGFSDPRFVEFSHQHWHLFDCYFSLSSAVAQQARQAGLRAGVMWPSVHPGFHDQFRVDPAHAEYDLIFMGNLATHPDAALRRRTLDTLREAGHRVCTIGQGGSAGRLGGEDLIRALARGRVGLNIMDENSTLPHRLFEYAAVGLCVVTTATPDIADAFSVGDEIVPYEPAALDALLKDQDRCARVGAAGHERCVRDHTIAARVDDIMRTVDACGQR